MKKIKLFALALLAGAISFTSCDSDDPTGPTLSLTVVNADAWYGDTVQINYSISSNEKIETLTASTNNANVSFDDNIVLSGDYSASGEVLFVMPTSGLNDGESILVDFVAVDASGDEYKASETAIINIKEPTAATTALATEVTTGNFWHIYGPNHGAYNLDGDATVGQAEDAALKSMINTDDVGGAFTGSWETGNGTEYVKDNAFDYANATVEGATTSFEAGTSNGTVSNPVANDIYIAKKGTTYYAIKITAVNPSATKANDGQITFSYKKN